MARRRRQSLDACAALNQLGIKPGTNFFTLPPSKVVELLEVADAVGYRKPKNANGSRGPLLLRTPSAEVLTCA